MKPVTERIIVKKNDEEILNKINDYLFLDEGDEVELLYTGFSVLVTKVVPQCIRFELKKQK